MPAIRQRHETIPQAMILAAVGGFLDAFTFVRFSVFANAQSGNIVLLAVDGAAGQWSAALLRLAPIGAFIAGVLVVEELARPAARRLLHRPLRVVLCLEIVGLLVVSVLPTSTPELVITVTVSFVAAIQFATFRMVAGQAYTTLLTSGNLRSAVTHVHRWIVEKDADARTNAGRFGKVILAFVVGAGAGAVVTRHINNFAALVPSVLLLVVLVLLVIETRRLGNVSGGDGHALPVEAATPADGPTTPDGPKPPQ